MAQEAKAYFRAGGKAQLEIRVLATRLLVVGVDAWYCCLVLLLALVLGGVGWDGMGWDGMGEIDEMKRIKSGRAWGATHLLVPD